MADDGAVAAGFLAKLVREAEWWALGVWDGPNVQEPSRGKPFVCVEAGFLEVTEEERVLLARLAEARTDPSAEDDDG